MAAFSWGPVCVAEQRSRRQGFGEDCLSEPAQAGERVPQPLAPESSAGKSPQATDASGCAFLWLLSFAQAKESNSPSGETLFVK